MSNTPPPATAPTLEILIVDDDPAILATVSEVLSQHGHRARSAESPNNALHDLEHFPCDLVITDISMPKMNGLELVAVIRRLYPRIRIVVMTGQMQPLTDVNLRHLGIDRFLSKPFTVVELMRAVNQIAAPTARSASLGTTTPIQIPTAV